jgi:hypothetical protein
MRTVDSTEAFAAALEGDDAMRESAGTMSITEVEVIVACIMWVSGLVLWTKRPR